MIKTVIGLATSIGVGQVTKNIMKVTTPANLSKAQKAATAIGGGVLAIMASNKAVEYVEKEYDEFLGIFTKQEEEEIISE